MMYKHNVFGITLFETLLTITLCGFCLLSLFTLQMATLKLAHDNYFTFLAYTLANNLLEHVAAHPSNQKYSLGCYPITTCLTQSELENWQQIIRAHLPFGDSHIDASKNIITITWNIPSQQNKIQLPT